MLKPGKYIVAVSGGVDSVVLLDILSKDHNLELVVAHVDHGIREDSSHDALFVEGLAKIYGFKYTFQRFELGPQASEDLARKYRYNFLHQVLKDNQANAIVTAHHQDDLIETAAINIKRGTKRRGFVSLKSTQNIIRPLLYISKADIYEYAISSKLEWQEDSTNRQMNYLRNRLRGKLHKNLTPAKRADIVKILNKIEIYDQQINKATGDYLADITTSLNRADFNSLDEDVAAEILATWLRNNRVFFDKKTMKRVIKGSKELRNGAKIDLDKNYYFSLTRNEIVLSER